MTSDAAHQVTNLSTSQSWALLREAAVGRLAVVADDHPDIFPVNFVVDHGSIVIRTAEGTKLAAADGRTVAFEADGYDPGSGEAWSVVAKGQAQKIGRLHELLDSVELPLFPWQAGPKPHFLRIEPDSITGRRFHPVDASASTMPNRGSRHTPPE